MRPARHGRRGLREAVLEEMTPPDTRTLADAGRGQGFGTDASPEPVEPTALTFQARPLSLLRHDSARE